MPDVNEVLRATEDLRQTPEQVTGAVSSGAKGLAEGASDFGAFFKSPDNLLALAICLVSLVGLYRLLRSEQIIPAMRRREGGLLSSALAQHLAMRLILFAVLAALGLALLVARLTGFFEYARHMF
jgi:hypothetical protein